MRHGGVGTFVRNDLYESYKILVIDQSYEGILGILFQHNTTDHQFIVFSCYLPPENSPWGRNSEGFYSHLVSQIYFHNYVDLYFLCGDVNDRIGNLDDFARNVDDLSNRESIDSSKNKHGEALIDFLLETKMCITNGRISPELNGFTSKD